MAVGPERPSSRPTTILWPSDGFPTIVRRCFISLLLGTAVADNSGMLLVWGIPLQVQSRSPATCRGCLWSRLWAQICPLHLRRLVPTNFDQPFTFQGWLHSASNFGETHFRRSPTFRFSTPKTSENINLLHNFERPFPPPRSHILNVFWIGFNLFPRLFICQVFITHSR